MNNSEEKIELRKIWRKSWLESLYEFANSDFQRGLWVEGSYKGLGHSFVECMCCYFNDLGLDEGYQPIIDGGLVSKEEADALSHFHELADQYEKERKSDENILTDPKWSEVVIAAARSWHRLKGIISDPRDIAVIKELEEKFGEIPNTP